VAERYRRLGALRDALALYVEAALWEEAVACMAALDMARRAERLVRACLARGRTPRLLCLLGGLTAREEHFAEAWDLSGGRSAAAAMALARAALGRGDLAAAAARLDAATRLAPADDAAWFLAGAVAMRRGEWEAALAAFSRVVQVAPERSDAWGNLGAVHLRLRQWGRGYAALEQAVRMDRKDWRLWSNFLTAALRTRAFSRALHVMRTLVTMQRERVGGEEVEGVDFAAARFLAREVLLSHVEGVRGGALAAQAPPAAAAAAESAAEAAPETTAPLLPPWPGAALDDDSGGEEGGAAVPGAAAAAAEADAAARHLDCDGSPARIHLEGLAATLEHWVQSLTPPPELWGLYADVQEARGRAAEALACTQREWRARVAAPGWERDEAALSAVAAAAARVAEAMAAGGARALPLEAKATLKTVLARVRADPHGLHDHGALSKLRELLGGEE